jgi:hypothetical protein
MKALNNILNSIQKRTWVGMSIVAFNILCLTPILISNQCGCVAYWLFSLATYGYITSGIMLALFTLAVIVHDNNERNKK